MHSNRVSVPALLEDERRWKNELILESFCGLMCVQAAVRALVRVGIREDEGLLDRLCNLMGSNKWWAKVSCS